MDPSWSPISALLCKVNASRILSELGGHGYYNMPLFGCIALPFRTDVLECEIKTTQKNTCHLFPEWAGYVNLWLWVSLWQSFQGQTSEKLKENKVWGFENWGSEEPIIKHQPDQLFKSTKWSTFTWSGSPLLQLPPVPIFLSLQLIEVTRPDTHLHT